MEELNQVFFDQNGQTFAYFIGKRLYAFDGRLLGYEQDNHIFACNGQQIAFLKQGWLWSIDGYALLVSKYAWGGPNKPELTRTTRISPRQEATRSQYRSYLPRREPVIKHNWHNEGASLYFASVLVE